MHTKTTRQCITTPPKHRLCIITCHRFTLPVIPVATQDPIYQLCFVFHTPALLLDSSTATIPPHSRCHLCTSSLGNRLVICICISRGLIVFLKLWNVEALWDLVTYRSLVALLHELNVPSNVWLSALATSQMMDHQRL